jgi:hypothetical protein
MAKTLTAAAIEKLRAGKARREIPDGGCAGLYLQIGTTGAKSWTFRYRRPGSGASAKLTLGKTDLSGRKPRPVEQLAMGSMLTLAEARTLASQVVMVRENGRDPGVDRLLEKKQRKAEESTADTRTFPSFARLYVERFAKANRRDWKEVARVLGLDPDDDLKIIPDGTADRWQSRPAAAVSKAEVVAELDRAVAEARGATRGNKLLAALKAMWNWHIDRGALEASPCARVKMPVPAKALRRSRRLSDNELRALWAGLDDAVKAGQLPPAYAALQRLCCITLVRRDEAMLMVAGEVDGDTWVVPSLRMGKTGVDHAVPLTREAKAQIAIAQGQPGRSGYVFSLDGGKTPLGGLSKWKRRLDLAMLLRLKGVALERNDQIALAHWEEIERLIKLSADPKANEKDRRDAQKKLRAVWWTAHDFRRNGRSHLSKVVSPDIAERVLAHVIGGVRAHYDTYQYLDEKRRALQLWAREIERIVSGDGGKIIPMAPRRKRGRS